MISITFLVMNIKRNEWYSLDTRILLINIREYRRGNQQWTPERNWQHRVHKTTKNKAQYVLDTTIRKQNLRRLLQKLNLISTFLLFCLTNKWRLRRTEQSFYGEIVTDITTPNSVRKDT